VRVVMTLGTIGAELGEGGLTAVAAVGDDSLRLSR
jgi:hypothetical protein